MNYNHTSSVIVSCRADPASFSPKTDQEKPRLISGITRKSVYFFAFILAFFA
jgi:hypothetical protein